MPATPPVGGFVLVDKPEGLSSHAVVARVRRRLDGIKGGHAGTLDPFATGLMIVLVGRCTRLMPWVVGQDKSYEMAIQLGVRSSSDDVTGELEPSGVPVPERAAVAEALEAVAARPTQRPPAVSAIHVEGTRAYQRVRRGEQVELPERPVQIGRADLVAHDQAAGIATVSVDCGSGTYMRSLARDLGEALGCGGAAAQLRRTRIGQLELADAVAPEDVVPASVRAPGDLVAHLPTLRLAGPQATDVTHGRAIEPDGLAERDQPDPDASICLVDRDELLAIARWRERDGRWQLQPRIVLVPAGREDT